VSRWPTGEQVGEHTGRASASHALCSTCEYQVFFSGILRPRSHPHVWQCHLLLHWLGPRIGQLDSDLQGRMMPPLLLLLLLVLVLVAVVLLLVLVLVAVVLLLLVLVLVVVVVLLLLLLMATGLSTDTRQ